MNKIFSVILEQGGVWGAVVLLLGAAIVYLYKQNTGIRDKSEDKFKADIDRITKEYRDQVEALTKANKVHIDKIAEENRKQIAKFYDEMRAQYKEQLRLFIDMLEKDTKVTSEMVTEIKLMNAQKGGS